MAGANIDYLLTETNMVNWLKGILVMRIADEAIRPYVEQEIQTFHSYIKSKFKHISLCGNCSSTNASICPSGICSCITSQIASAHRYKVPCYGNSDITKWLSDPMEIAKCYMSRITDLVGKPCSEIDFPSILNVVINNTRFGRLITAVERKNKSNIFCQGRDARNETIHSRSYETTEPQLNRHCDIFIEIVKRIGRDSKKYVERIVKVRDTPMSITTEDMVKLKEQAAIYQGLTDAVNEGMKKDLWDEVERNLMNMKDEIKKAIGSSLIHNFVEGCKESFYRLIVEHIQRQKPERIEKDNWTVAKFVDRLDYLPQVKELSKDHRKMLFPSPGSTLDITKWDIYLFCFVLNIKTEHPLENRVVKFITDAKLLRNKLLDDPSGVENSELSNLCGYLHKPMKDVVLSLFERERTVVDMINENNVLLSWRRHEDIESQARYRRVNAERDADVSHAIAEITNNMSMLEARIPQDFVSRLYKLEIKLNYNGMNKIVENSEKGAADEAIESYETQVEVKPCNVSKIDEENLQQMMTSTDQNNQVLHNTGARELFENVTAGCTIKEIAKGSIILKVDCPSLAALFGFWKGCTDGTVVTAMSKIRDAYRKHLGCDRLEFDIVLKKKEVARCKIKIIEDLNSRLELLEEQMTGINDLNRQPVDNLNSRLQRLEEQVNGVNDLISQPAQKPEEIAIIPCITEDKDITVEGDIPIAIKGKHLPKRVHNEGASKSDPKSFGDDVPRSKMLIDEEIKCVGASQSDTEPLAKRSKRLRPLEKRVWDIGDDVPRSKMFIDEETKRGGAGKSGTEPLGIMASVDIDTLLNNAANVNWLKGVLVMDISDEAIRPFVEAEMKKFHSDITSNLKHGSLCGKCKSTNAKHCHSGKCSDITSQIESAHRFKGPFYKNSDITKWFSDPWEIAKCYMSRSWDLEEKPGSDIDCPSLLNIVINNKRFETLITEVDMTNEKNVFCQGQMARNKTMQSKRHQMTEAVLNNYCNIFIEIVNLIGAVSKQHAKNIEKVRDTPLFITAEEIVKLKEQAAIYQKLTEDDIENMKTKMWEEAVQVIKYIKVDTEKVIGTSLIANFTEGCKESLQRLTIEHIQRQVPDDIGEDEGTVAKFVESLRFFTDIKKLSPRHVAMLLQNTHTEKDIRKWDLFLLCFILQIELPVPVANNVRLYVIDVRAVRDKFLLNRDEQNDIVILLGYLDDPLKSDTLRIFNKKNTMFDTIHALNDLISWHREEDQFNRESRYRRADIKMDKQMSHMEQRLFLMEQRMLAAEQHIQMLVSSVGQLRSQDINRDEEIQAEATGGIAATSYEVNVNIVPQNVSQKENEVLQISMTSAERNNAIFKQINFPEDFKRKTECKPHSKVLKVECRSVEKLVEFWKGCIDETVDKAKSTLEDAYMRNLGNDKLEFDIVLKMKEVIRCRNTIFEYLNFRLERLPEQLTDVDSLISQIDDSPKPLQIPEYSEHEHLDVNQ